MLVYENGKYVCKDASEMPELPNFEVPYEEMVISLIRERYSLDEELAIQRQRDTKPEEFEIYFNYCEECKKRAKNI